MRKTALFVTIALAIAGCSDRADQDAAAPRQESQTKHPQAAVIDEHAIDDVWHQAKLRGVAFRAIGQEPGWLLEITNGQEILLVTNYGGQRVSHPYVDPVVFQDERRTEYRLPDNETIIEIRGEPCTDTMSGERFAVSVTVKQPDNALTGCGRALF